MDGFFPPPHKSEEEAISYLLCPVCALPCCVHCLAYTVLSRGRHSVCHTGSGLSLVWDASLGEHSSTFHQRNFIIYVFTQKNGNGGHLHCSFWSFPCSLVISICRMSLVFQWMVWGPLVLLTSWRKSCFGGQLSGLIYLYTRWDQGGAPKKRCASTRRDYATRDSLRVLHN